MIISSLVLVVVCLLGRVGTDRAVFGAKSHQEFNITKRSADPGLSISRDWILHPNAPENIGKQLFEKCHNYFLAFGAL